MTQEDKIKHFETATGLKYNTNLEYLDASGCDKLEALPDMPNLKTLDARGCDKLEALPDMPNLEYLYARGCDKLEALPDMPNLKYLDASGCDKLEALPDMPNLEYLDARGCDKLEALPDMPNLKTLDARGCDKLEDVKRETLITSKSIGSRYGITQYWVEADEVICGCFRSNLDSFEKRIMEVYPNGKYHNQYMSFITKCKSFISGNK